LATASDQARDVPKKLTSGTGDVMDQVGGYHPIKTLDPNFVLPVLR
jgi:hypothetical protein